jgi:hypothetical protein
MPIAKLTDDIADGRRRSRTRTKFGEMPETPPRLWPQLPIEIRRRLAQHVGQLLQRLRPLSAHAREEHCVDDDVVER